MEIEGRLEGLQSYEIHGTRYFRAFYTLAGAPDEILDCRLPFDAIDTDLHPGDPILLTTLLKTVMEIRRAIG